MKNRVTSSKPFRQVGWRGEDRVDLFGVIRGVPADKAIDAAHCMVDHAMNLINSVPAEDDLPETIKHAVDGILEQARVTLSAVITGSDDIPLIEPQKQTEE